MLKRIILPTLLASFIHCSLGYAHEHHDQPASVPQLSEYLDQQMTAMEGGVVSGNTNVQPTAKTESTYFLRRFWLRIQAKAGVAIPGILKAQVIPEIEVLLERPLPNGW